MPPTTIDQKAFVKLKELSIWLSETNEFKEEQENLFRCVDEGRHAKVDPLLEELGFNKVKVIWPASYSELYLRFLGIWLLIMACCGKKCPGIDQEGLPVPILPLVDTVRVR